MICQNPDCEKPLSEYRSYGETGRKRKYCDARCRAAAYRRKHGIERKITRQITVHADELLDLVLVAGAWHNEKARKELLHLMHRHGLENYLSTVDWEMRKAAAEAEARRSFRHLHGL